eukprot:scaffold1925_cov400-Prasinococcus_capsulatus_cf.AAC.1
MTRSTNCALGVLQIAAKRPTKYSNTQMSKREKTVNRVYGGCLSHRVVRDRYARDREDVLQCSATEIVRAFLVEEQKIVKKVLKMQKAKSG